MTLKIEFANRSKAPIYVKDNDYNNLTSIDLVGRYVENYGETLWTDVLRILENWANEIPPLRPTEGQFWYDTSNKQLKVNTARQLGQGNWVNVGTKEQTIPSGVLKLSGGLLNNELFIANDITSENDPATKSYVDANCIVKLKSDNSKYQYNILSFCNYATINGIVSQINLSSGAYKVTLPVVMKDDNYSVILSASTTAPNGLIPANAPLGHHFFISNKTINGFTIGVDTSLPVNCEIDFTVIGYAA